jgi:fructoselysine transporter
LLQRKLGLIHSVSIIVGTVIGSGVFINLPIVARNAGSPMLAILAWLIGGLIWIPQVFIITEMATAYPGQGFGYLYLKKADKPALAFLYVWSAFITSDTPSISIIAMSAVSALAVFWAPFDDPVFNRLFAILLILVLTIPHYRDVKTGGNLQIILTAIKISPLLLLVILGAIFCQGHHLTANETLNAINLSAFGAVGAGVAATVWPYAGIPNLLYMAGEIKNPSKTLPFALIGSVLAIMTAYVLISLATFAIVPYEELISFVGSFANPFLYLPFFAAFAAAFLGIFAFISMIGATNACIMVQPRMEYAIARDGLFFKPFAHLHPKYKTPDYSIMIQSGLAMILVIVGGLEALLGYFTLSYVLQNLLVYFAIFWVRRKEDYNPSFKSPAWRWMALLSISFQLGLIYMIFLAFPTGGILSALALILTGLPLYYYFKKSAR